MSCGSVALRNSRVLLLEDNYYLADDVRRALQKAGADVVGPFFNVDEALAEADRRKPCCAVVDINLGSGPSFDAARALIARDIKVIFLTGYDKELIPDDLAGTPRLLKPVDERKVVELVEAICPWSD